MLDVWTRSCGVEVFVSAGRSHMKQQQTAGNHESRNKHEREVSSGRLKESGHFIIAADPRVQGLRCVSVATPGQAETSRGGSVLIKAPSAGATTLLTQRHEGGRPPAGTQSPQCERRRSIITAGVVVDTPRPPTCDPPHPHCSSY